MLLIQSSSSDTSTNDVLDWLYYLAGKGLDVVRLNDTGQLQSVTIGMDSEGQSVSLGAKGRQLDLDQLYARWYRRGMLSLPYAAFSKQDQTSFALALHTRSYLDAELRVVYGFIENYIDQQAAGLNRRNDDETNKLDNLKLAADLGLRIPETLVTNEPDALLSFARQHETIITKSLGRNHFICPFGTEGSLKIGLGTVLLQATDLESWFADKPAGPLPMPALFQRYVSKKVELRIFYLDGSFYPMAIFSQAQAHTRVDFRNYDPARPNRCVPFNLPYAVEVKLDALMQTAGLTSGSIDMILTPDDDYVFLEVNPVGQFQWLSRNCNYDINKQIARYLLS